MPNILYFFYNKNRNYNLSKLEERKEPTEETKNLLDGNEEIKTLSDDVDEDIKQMKIRNFKGGKREERSELR